MEGSSGSRERRDARLRGTSLGLLLLLAAQNLVGLFLNLFVSVNDPTGYDGAIPAMFASPSGALHVVLALLLLGNVIALLVIAWPTRSIALRGAGVAALLSFMVAGYAGFHFVTSQENLYSITIEAGFLGVVLSAAAVLYLLASRRPSPAVPSAGDPVVT